jgi:DNA repair protein RadD
MITLRPYQQEAVEAVYNHLRVRDDNPCVVLPTASGKTFVIAQICMDSVLKWGGRVIILAHVKELLEQAAEKLMQTTPELMLKVGIYSAGLKSRDTEQPIIIAGIQSVYKRACELDAFDLIIVDESHLIPPDGEGMYRTFLADVRAVNPNVRVIGLTATPFRMKSGLICEPDNFLNHVCYEAGVRELIVQNYLCPLITKAGKEKADTSSLHIRAGEFIPGETEALMNTDKLVESACAEIIEHTQNRNSVLVFAAGVEHGKHVAAVLREKHGAQVATVFGHTPARKRDETIHDFKSGNLKFLVNVNVLTTGFDAPNIDSVAMLRPTMSPGLYYQMTGRGFRLHPGKENCLVLDFGGNVMRHGPVDAIRIQKPKTNGSGPPPAKECPECHSVIHAAYTICPDCGYEFPKPERATHDAKASTAGILSGDVEITEYPVEAVYFDVHTKYGAPDDAPKTMRVEYKIGWQFYQSEWICFEHTGWARHKAASWWRQRSNAPVPDTAAEAVDMAEAGALCKIESITVRSVSGEKYDRIIGYKLGKKPFYREPGWDDEDGHAEEVEAELAYSDEEPPF